mmetsp:Transcript_1509/g.4369  ORF Transcript_1509/g.4369 Transcript_1509/m.4369 type:complete len:200 (-) Transcript_1509:121-720(-)
MDIRPPQEQLQMTPTVLHKLGIEARHGILLGHRRHDASRPLLRQGRVEPGEVAITTKDGRVRRLRLRLLRRGVVPVLLDGGRADLDAIRRVLHPHVVGELTRFGDGNYLGIEEGHGRRRSGDGSRSSRGFWNHSGWIRYDGFGTLRGRDGRGILRHGRSISRWGGRGRYGVHHLDYSVSLNSTSVDDKKNSAEGRSYEN